MMNCVKTQPSWFLNCLFLLLWFHYYARMLGFLLLATTLLRAIFFLSSFIFFGTISWFSSCLIILPWITSRLFLTHSWMAMLLSSRIFWSSRSSRFSWLRRGRFTSTLFCSFTFTCFLSTSFTFGSWSFLGLLAFLLSSRFIDQKFERFRRLRSNIDKLSIDINIKWGILICEIIECILIIPKSKKHNETARLTLLTFLKKLYRASVRRYVLLQPIY